MVALPRPPHESTRRAPVLCALVLAASGCAGKASAPATPPPTPAPPATDACAPETYLGPWLIEQGTAGLTCDDGTRVTLAAGGYLHLEQNLSPGVGPPLVLRDGQCRYPLTRDACALAGTAGITCTDDGTSYTSRDLRLSPDAAGRLSVVYALEHPDPEHPDARCVARTEARLTRAARRPEACSIEGRWEATITSDGKPGRTALHIAQGRCTVEAPGHASEGLCQRAPDTLSLQATGTGKNSCAAATYDVTFSHDCTGLALEARADPCAPRRHALEFLYLRKAP